MLTPDYESDVNGDQHAYVYRPDGDESFAMMARYKYMHPIDTSPANIEQIADHIRVDGDVIHLGHDQYGTFHDVPIGSTVVRYFPNGTLAIVEPRASQTPEANVLFLGGESTSYWNFNFSTRSLPSPRNYVTVLSQQYGMRSPESRNEFRYYIFNTVAVQARLVLVSIGQSFFASDHALLRSAVSLPARERLSAARNAFRYDRYCGIVAAAIVPES